MSGFENKAYPLLIHFVADLSQISGMFSSRGVVSLLKILKFSPGIDGLFFVQFVKCSGVSNRFYTIKI